MGIIDYTFVHHCQVLSTSQDQRLDFVSGSVAFSVGKLLTGSISKATGTIKNIILLSGNWPTGTATGYLILSAVSGDFVDDETITDDGVYPGRAASSGTLIPQTNAAGTPTTTTLTLPSESTYYDCLFKRISTSGNYILTTDAGKMIFSSIVVFLKETAQVREGDHIITSEPHWAGVYVVYNVDALEIPYTKQIDHIEAYLSKVSKRVQN